MEHFKRPMNEFIGLLMCAMHGDKLDGASPLWRFVITNH